MPQVKSNLWKINLYRFFSDFWIMVPVLIPFYQSNGLAATQVFTIQAVFSATALIFEIPSGYFSDVVGRRKTMILSSLLLPTGLLVYCLGNSFWWFAAAEFILGIANSLRSGTDSALIYDSLQENNSEAEYKKYEGSALFYNRAGTALASILGGLCAVVSLRLPLYLNFAVTLLLTPVAFTLIEPKRQKPKHPNPILAILQVTEYCLTQPQLRTLVAFFSILTGTGLTCFWSYYMYYGKAGIEVGYFGLILAVFLILSALSSRQAHLTEKILGPGRSLAILLLIGPILILLGLYTSPWMLPLIFLHALIWGFSEPVIADLINRLTSSDVRATVISVASMFGRLGFVIIAPIFGRLVDLYSLSTALLSLGIFFLAGGAICVFLLREKGAIYSTTSNGR
jgi:MFS family permease